MSLGLAEGSRRALGGCRCVERVCHSREVAVSVVRNAGYQRRAEDSDGHRLPASLQRLQPVLSGGGAGFAASPLFCSPATDSVTLRVTQPSCSGGNTAGIPLQTLLPCVPSASAQPRPELHLLVLQPKRRPRSKIYRRLLPRAACCARGSRSSPSTTPALCSVRGPCLRNGY